MPQVDDDYRKKASLARFKQNASKREQGRISKAPKEPNIPASMMPYQAKATPISKNAARMGLVVDGPLPVDPSGAVGIGSTAGRIATPLIGRIAGPTMQRALGVADTEGKQIAGGILSDAAAQGVRFNQSSVARGGKAAQEELFNFMSELERIGVKPATANKLLRGFSRYVDDPVEGIAELGGNVGRSAASGMDAKEALVKRLLGRLGNAAEDSFF